MNWTNLTAPAPYKWLSKKTAALRKELAKDITAVLESRSGHDRWQQQAAETPLDDADVSSVFTADMPQLNRFEILQRELRLRRRLTGYLQLEQQDRSRGRSAAAEALEAKKAEIAERLLSIGYVEPSTDAQVRGAYVPGWAHFHPEVRDARDEFDSLGYATDTQPNDEAILQLETQLETLRRRALAAA